MKVNQQITLFAGAQDTMEGGAAQSAGKNQEKRKTVFAGGLNQEKPFRDRVAEKKEQARQNAMKIVNDAFAGDKVIDDDLESRREHIRQMTKERARILEEKQNVTAQQESLEKDLEEGYITEEEYGQMKAELCKAENDCLGRLDENTNAVKAEDAAIRSTKIAQLKKSPMVKAQKLAEEELQAARDEIVDMAKEEGIEHIDEEAEEREKKAEEFKEEQEKKEEFIEKQKEKREEEEIRIEELGQEEMYTVVEGDLDVQKEIKEMLRKMKLLEEDLKGAAVDENV